MNTITDWARTWGVSDQALADLRARMGMFDVKMPDVPNGLSEAAIQARVRVQASRLGMRVWRNNVGAGYSEDGTFMRWGLANDSQKVNALLKSADLIGIRPHVIQQQDVGRLIGQFVSYEVKESGWRYSATDREVAQANWATLIASLGGDARFVTDERTL